jgi:hypothetical protein
MEPRGRERHRWVKPRGREKRERISQSAVADVSRGESLHVPSQRAGYSRSLFPSRAGARRGRGARPWQRSRSRRRRGGRTRCYCGRRCSCNCRTGSRRWTCTGCWCWTGQARTNHVNKTSDHLLVPFIGGLHARDKEATFILIGDYRAASWKLDCAFKNIHGFAEQESIRRQ